MAKLIYSAISSVDGYVADAEGNFDWSAPDQEVRRFVNELERPIGTYLYGRRMYEVMRYWAAGPRYGSRLGGAIALDRPDRQWRLVSGSGVREDLASSRQDRLLQEPGAGIQRPNID
ncbi:MAG TPA: hypothetical protein VK499_09880 [Propionibacteriaceae bacterium]|jgi:dihydrofolate reductase|nr:hypothetical protein [Propionibacteriaceae bacterium]